MANVTATEVSEPAGLIPHDATCADCGYSLFNLETFRCPECGRPFDPAVAATMWFGRPLGRVGKFFASPIGPRLRWLVLWETLAGIWGLALLPGAYLVALLAQNALLVTCGYAMLRGAIRLLMRITYRKLPRRRYDDRKLRSFSRIVLILCMASWFNLPREINLLISRPFYMRMAMRVWSEEPMYTSEVPTGVYGLLFVTGGRVEPGGVSLYIAGSDASVYVTEEQGKVVARVHARSNFEVVAQVWRDIRRFSF